MPSVALSHQESGHADELSQRLALILGPDNHPLYLLGSESEHDQERACEVVEKILLDPEWLHTWCAYQRGGRASVQSLSMEAQQAIAESGVYASFIEGTIQ